MGTNFNICQYSVIMLHQHTYDIVSRFCAYVETVSSSVMTESVYQAFVI